MNDRSISIIDRHKNFKSITWFFHSLWISQPICDDIYSHEVFKFKWNRLFWLEVQPYILPITPLTMQVCICTWWMWALTCCFSIIIVLAFQSKSLCVARHYVRDVRWWIRHDCLCSHHLHVSTIAAKFLYMDMKITIGKCVPMCNIYWEFTWTAVKVTSLEFFFIFQKNADDNTNCPL